MAPRAVRKLRSRGHARMWANCGQSGVSGGGLARAEYTEIPAVNELTRNHSLGPGRYFNIAATCGVCAIPSDQFTVRMKGSG